MSIETYRESKFLVRTTEPAAPRKIIILFLGMLLSAGILILFMLEALGITRSGIGSILVDLHVNGETNMPASSGEYFHGEWGDRMFSIMAAPMLIAMAIAMCIEALEEYFDTD